MLTKSEVESYAEDVLLDYVYDLSRDKIRQYLGYAELDESDTEHVIETVFDASVFVKFEGDPPDDDADE